MRTSQRLASFALAFALAAPASALIDNSGSFAGSERLHVRGCGLHGRAVSGDYVFSNGFYQGGAFTLNIGGSLYTGTYRVEAPRALRFSFDAASTARFSLPVPIDPCQTFNPPPQCFGAGDEFDIRWSAGGLVAPSAEHGEDPVTAPRVATVGAAIGSVRINTATGFPLRAFGDFGPVGSSTSTVQILDGGVIRGSLGGVGAGAPDWLHEELGEDRRLKIPHANATLRSLNLSTAAGIACSCVPPTAAQARITSSGRIRLPPPRRPYSAACRRFRGKGRRATACAR